VSAVDFLVADMIQSTVWNYYQWSFAMKQKLKVGSVFLADAVQDITGVPTDFGQLIWARLTRTDLSDGNHYRELTPVQRLDQQAPTNKFPFNAHEFISHAPEVSAFRLEYPLMIDTTTPELTQLDIEYQKVPTKITAANFATPFVEMPDEFFPLFCDGVLWRFMTLANDKRQGGMQITSSGNKVYTGQMGVFYNGLSEQAAADREMYGMLRFPAQGSLGAVRSQGSGWVRG
jgi:hypothetical protein